MRRIDSVVIGGGQAGLAMSRCLTDRGVDHIVLERGRIAERWRSERWDSLRLLTPNWQTRLPGFGYDGEDVDGFMTMPEVIDFFERYATSFRAPVECGVDVRGVTRHSGGFRVATTNGEWLARTVVVATGYSQLPAVPALSRDLPHSIAQMTPAEYRSPAQVADGGVMIVGASASGIQLADELQRAGRQVTIAVGHHVRLPRTYRGRDILWWLDRMGVFDDTADHVYDVDISRDQPSLQLIGHPDRITLNLASLRDRGARVVGRLHAIDGTTAHFGDDLVTTTAAADIKMAALLHRIDAFVAAGSIDAPPAQPFAPHCLTFQDAPASLRLRDANVRTVIWATGFRRAYPWLHLPVLTRQGEIAHNGGITAALGVYVLGLHFLRRRNSSFIDGVGADALALSAHLAHFLDRNRKGDRAGAA